jgi:hypothetical protein
MTSVQPLEDDKDLLCSEILALTCTLQADTTSENFDMPKNLLIKTTKYLTVHPFSSEVYNAGLYASSRLHLPESASHSLANIQYLQAQLLRFSPEGPDASGYIAKLEEAVKTGVLANPHATTKRKVQLKREKELREVRIFPVRVDTLS